MFTSGCRRRKMAEAANETLDFEALVLGIDLGTTSVKVSLVCHSSRNVMESIRFETNAGICGVEPNFAEQDVTKVLTVLNHALRNLSSALLGKVTRIGICGQMHGCMMWKEKCCLDWETFDDYLATTNSISHLITWEDGRCTPEFLSSLPSAHQKAGISTGFGCATLFWLKRKDPGVLEYYDFAGTIMDFIVCIFCQSDKPCMSSQSASSWGYFDVDKMTWELDLLEKADFPTHLLPVVFEPGVVAGKLQKPFFGIPVGTPVGVALGDFQCSVLSSTSHLSDAVFNLGTGCQMAVVIPDDACVDERAESGQIPAVEITSDALHVFPYFKGMKVITATSLSGADY